MKKTFCFKNVDDFYIYCLEHPRTCMIIAVLVENCEVIYAQRDITEPSGYIIKTGRLLLESARNDELAISTVKMRGQIINSYLHGNLPRFFHLDRKYEDILIFSLNALFYFTEIQKSYYFPMYKDDRSLKYPLEYHISKTENVGYPSFQFSLDMTVDKYEKYILTFNIEILELKEVMRKNKIYGMLEGKYQELRMAIYRGCQDKVREYEKDIETIKMLNDSFQFTDAEKLLYEVGDPE